MFMRNADIRGYSGSTALPNLFFTRKPILSTSLSPSTNRKILEPYSSRCILKKRSLFSKRKKNLWYRFGPLGYLFFRITQLFVFLDIYHRQALEGIIPSMFFATSWPPTDMIPKPERSSFTFNPTVTGPHTRRHLRSISRHRVPEEVVSPQNTR